MIKKLTISEQIDLDESRKVAIDSKIFGCFSQEDMMIARAIK
jgi:hypothetical protein